MPRAIAALIEKMKPDFSGLTKWEQQKLENHRLHLLARDERVIKAGKPLVKGVPNNRASKRNATKWHAKRVFDAVSVHGHVSRKVSFR